jgi:cytochrome b
MTSTLGTARIKVWDPLVRLGHWALVIGFAIAYLSSEEEHDPDALHVWAGYAIGTIVALRVLWGFFGTEHARFSDFVTSPASALRYAVDEIGGRARRYVGHSPAGGAMIVALLLSLSLTVTTGLLAYGDRGKGPFARGGVAAIAQAYADEHKAERKREGKEGESVFGEAHALLANITLGLIILHILGVAFSSYAHRENLIGAMFTGEKRANGPSE